ncbi:LysR family transcriptional regulator [Grimontia kaedaensis]|uniref:LysR family transcriptional regulator n=1 Tax=Grimontia kaedaensis TaxID=2872157 RepID=A0ABY4X344_9GAMM|nr:LysR family transcriptional regulator [Grimontia kaedaensis]USH05702.1 LysR family transcriptional regulator [Grimontia kaedaensis]
MNIEHLKLFVRIASTNNISAAGAELGLSPAVSSTHINKLEESMGVRLVHRTTRKVSLTEEGIAFLPHAEDVLDSVEAACASVGAGTTSPRGTLRITAPASFGRMHLIPGLKGFLEEYPDLSLDLRLSDSIVDLVEGGFDIAIRNAELKDSSLIARKLAPDNRMLCASPSYIAKNGKPETLDELSSHTFVQLPSLEQLSFRTLKGIESIKVKSLLKTDNGEAVRDACINGIGISVCSNWAVHEQLERGELVRILENYQLESDTAIWAVYPSSRQLAPKVRAFIDHFVQRFANLHCWGESGRS